MEAASEPGALPLVQEALRILWDCRRRRLLGLAEYEALGDGASALQVAIAHHADAAMRTLNPAQQTMAHRVLLRLVNFGEGRPDTRQQQKLQALRSATDDDGEFARVVMKLVEHRLLTIDRGEQADAALVDLSHEALISAWPALQHQIAQRRADEQRRRRLEATWRNGSSAVAESPACSTRWSSWRPNAEWPAMLRASWGTELGCWSWSRRARGRSRRTPRKRAR